MITKKQLKRTIDDLSNEVKKLNEIVVTDELKKLREIKRLYEEQTNLLSNVKFRVKSVKLNEDLRLMTIIYQLPIIQIELDEDGKPINKNPFFYSTNVLELVSNEDFDKIRETLLKAQKIAINNKNKN